MRILFLLYVLPPFASPIPSLSPFTTPHFVFRFRPASTGFLFTRFFSVDPPFPWPSPPALLDLFLEGPWFSDVLRTETFLGSPLQGSRSPTPSAGYFLLAASILLLLSTVIHVAAIPRGLKLVSPPRKRILRFLVQFLFSFLGQCFF